MNRALSLISIMFLTFNLVSYSADRIEFGGVYTKNTITIPDLIHPKPEPPQLIEYCPMVNPLTQICKCADGFTMQTLQKTTKPNKHDENVTVSEMILCSRVIHD